MALENLTSTYDLPACGLVHNENLAGSAQGPGKAE